MYSATRLLPASPHHIGHGATASRRRRFGSQAVTGAWYVHSGAAALARHSLNHGAWRKATFSMNATYPDIDLRGKPWFIQWGRTALSEDIAAEPAGIGIRPTMSICHFFCTFSLGTHCTALRTPRVSPKQQSGDICCARNALLPVARDYARRGNVTTRTHSAARLAGRLKRLLAGRGALCLALVTRAIAAAAAARWPPLTHLTSWHAPIFLAAAGGEDLTASHYLLLQAGCAGSKHH